MKSQNKILAASRKFPLHTILLPFFFILNIYNEFAGLLAPGEIKSAFFWIAGGMIVLFFILLPVYRDRTNAGILATIAGGLYLFFGNIKETLSRLPLLELLSHYRFLLPVLFIALAFLTYRLYRRPPMTHVNLFLTILLIIYTGIEQARLFIPTTNKKGSADRLQPVPGSTVKHLPIYFIVPDCYPSSSYQREVLGVAANQLDSALNFRGFYIANRSKSNYKYTAFSMASTFDMNYLGWLGDVVLVKPYHYNRATQQVEQATIFKWLKTYNYSIKNFSVFDLPGSPSVKKERFLSTTGTEIIFYNSFYKCIRRDVLPALFPKLGRDLVDEQHTNNKKLLEGFRDYNQRVIDSLIQVIHPSQVRNPVFVYAHLELPHFPYFFDADGKAYAEKDVFGDAMITSKERFSGYITYTNNVLTTITDSILSRHNGQVIIVIQSDHGLNDIAGSKRDDAFRNYSAFYFPDRNYDVLYDSISNVNTFRIIFNKYFSQQLTLLPDSTRYTK